MNKNIFNKRNVPEIVIPTFHNTYEIPKEPRNYTIWLNKANNFEMKIYIKDRWFNVSYVVSDEENEEYEDSELTIEEAYAKIDKIMKRVKK